MISRKRAADTAPEPAEAAPAPAWKPWTAAEDSDAHRDQADYDITPNDEGDDN